MSEPGWATPMEAALWRKLARCWPGWIREYSTGPYRLDFYCPTAKLAVEIDGSSHASYEAARHDMQRDGWHRDQGILTLRFTNGDIARRRGDVLARIQTAVACRTAPASWWTRRMHQRAVRTGQVAQDRPCSVSLVSQTARNLLQSWMDAVVAREQHAAQFFSSGFGTDDAEWVPGRVLDLVAMDELEVHAEVERLAREAYYDAIEP